MQHTLFVYGTLRRGFSNHPLMRGAQCLGPAVTRQKYALYCKDIPYLCREPRHCSVRGEVYVVDEYQLKRIDRLEEHPHWYVRERIEVILDNGRRVTAWCYFNDAPAGRLLASGDYAEAGRGKLLMPRH